MKLKIGFAIAALAAICMLVAPALSVPENDGMGRSHAQWQDKGMNCQERCMNGQENCMMDGKDGFGKSHDGMYHGLLDPMLLLDNETISQIDNMTVTQFQDLMKQKAAELDKMTLGEIKELHQKKMQERRDKMNSTTIGELKNMKEMKCHQNGMMGSGKMNPADMPKIGSNMGPMAPDALPNTEAKN